MPPRRARLPRTPKPDAADPEATLFGRLLKLEERVMALEVQLRGDASAAELSGSASSASDSSGPPAKRRTRCPGCLLELPKGRKGPSCVWCGFYFEAVEVQG